MKTLIGALGVGALLLASACIPRTYERPTYGWGGAGPDLGTAEVACKRAAAREGWRWLQMERAEAVSASEARIQFEAQGIPFRTHLTCFYNARTAAVTLR